MKSIQIRISLLIGLTTLSTFFVSCKKKDIISEPTGISWNFRGKTTMSYTDSAYVLHQYGTPAIIATVAGAFGRGTAIRMTLGSLTIGNYDLESFSFGVKNILYYFEYDAPGLIGWISKKGSINITANTGTRLSGNFSCILTELYHPEMQFEGTFINVPIVK